MKDGAIISNSGHFNVEIDIPALEKLSSSKRTTRTFVEEYSLRDGRKINLLGEGRLINLASAEGHPPSVMDMSFADQALSVEYMVKNHKTLEKRVYKVPEDLDKRVARLKLESTGNQDRQTHSGAGRVSGGVERGDIEPSLVVGFSRSAWLSGRLEPPQFIWTGFLSAIRVKTWPLAASFCESEQSARFAPAVRIVAPDGA